MRAVDPAGMRRQNMMVTLRALIEAGHGTLAELAATTGLSRRTTEIILDSLREEGYARETAWETHRRAGRPIGRPARVFEFAADAVLVGAMVITPIAVQVSIADLAGEIVAEHAVATTASTSRADRLAAARRAFGEVLDRAGLTRQQIGAVTVATVGPVRDNGEVDLRMSIADWSGFSLAEALEEPLGCPVFVENDVKLGALGERWRGVARGVQDLIWIWNSSGRSGIGIVIQGQLYRGLDGRAGEIVWADSLGFDGLPDGILRPGSDAAAPGGDAPADVARTVERIQHGIETLVWTLAPEMIVLGPTLDIAADLIVPQLIERLSRKNDAIPAIVGSTLGDRAIVFGAIRRSLDHVEHDLFRALVEPADPAGPPVAAAHAGRATG